MMPRKMVGLRKGTAPKPAVVIAIGTKGKDEPSGDEATPDGAVQCPECGCVFQPGETPEQYDAGESSEDESA